MSLHVQCYAGRKADERPLRFQLHDHEYLSEEVVDQWFSPRTFVFQAPRRRRQPLQSPPSDITAGLGLAACIVSRDETGVGRTRWFHTVRGM